MLYKDIRDQLKTGDIVLFKGDRFTSKIIQFFSGSKYSHIGMVVRIPKYDMVMIWESTTLCNICDADSNAPVKGVQTVPFSSRFNTYDGEMYVRQLNQPIDDSMLTSLLDVRKELKHKPYEKEEIEFAKSLLDFNGAMNTEDLSSLFCSELVAEAYQRMGMLPNKIPSNEYIPRDFDQDKMADDNLIGYSLGPVLRIT